MYRNNDKLVSLVLLLNYFLTALSFVPPHRYSRLPTVGTTPIPAAALTLMKATNYFANNEIVTIECHLRPEGSFVPEPLFDGIIMDASPESSETLTFALGKGNYLPGLHDLVSTMDIAQSIQKMSIDAGWGAWNPDLQATIAFESLKGSGLDTSMIKKGVELVMGNGIRAVVTEISGDETEFVVDANPPLAGASYLADVKLLSREFGPTEFLYSPKEFLDSKYQVATFALGCFWGGELAYMREPGVVGTKVGYTQGEKSNPSYKEVCSGSTGHTESVMILYDSTIVSFERLVLFAMDRLGESKYMLNQVGNDKGTQYRHGVYYHNDKQKELAESIVESFGGDCVTEVLPAVDFFDAEDHHQQYLLKGGQSARKGDTSYIRCYG